jgi:uncharacterized phiE125 gp8 family phage protein
MALLILSSSAAPITVADAKRHLRIDGSDDDATLASLIPPAVEWLQAETRQQLAPATYRLTLDRFPAGRDIVLPRPPLQSVTEVRFVQDGDELPLESYAYTVSPSGSKPGRISLNPGYSWPATDDVHGSVRIDFVAGYSAGEVPTLLKQGVLLLVGHWHEHREAAIDRRIDTVPLALESIVTQHAFPEAV